MRNKLLLTALFILCCLLMLGSAYADSEEPALYGYDIFITAPDGWYAVSAKVAVTVTDIYNTGWSKLEYRRAGDSAWSSLADSFTVTENGSYTVRVTDPEGGIHEATEIIECIDKTAPEVTAGILDKLLHTEAYDSQSGVYGVLVDDDLYTTLVDGTLDLNLSDYTDAGEHFTVIGIDNAGNRSAATVIDNPYYSPATPTPKATPYVIYSPTPTPAPAPSGATTRSSTSTKATAASTVTTAATEKDTEQKATEESSEIVPGKGFQSGGNAVTRDLLYDEATNKQFISVETRDGGLYYLIIDYDKPVDEDDEAYETYFLNLVDSSDLAGFLPEEEDEPAPVCTCEDKCVIGDIDTDCPVCRSNLSECTGKESVTPPPAAAVSTPEPEEPNTPEDSKGSGKVVALVLLLGLMSAGVFLFLRKKKPQSVRGSTDLDAYYGEDEEETGDENP